MKGRLFFLLWGGWLGFVSLRILFFFLSFISICHKKSEHCFSSFSSISVSPLSFRHSLSNSLYRIDHLSLHNTPTDTIIHISCVFCFLQNFSLIESGQVNDLSSGADSIFFFRNRSFLARFSSKIFVMLNGLRDSRLNS